MDSGMKFVILTKENFRREVLKSSEPVLIDFWGRDCPPCHDLSPLVRQIAADYSGLIKVGRVDVDHDVELAEKYEVKAIPTLLLFCGGSVMDRIDHHAPRDVLVAILDSLILNAEC